VYFKGRQGGMLISPDEVAESIREVLAGGAVEVVNG